MPNLSAWANIAALSQAEFNQFKTWIYQTAGISLADSKNVLVMGRLRSRVTHHRLTSYGDYFRLLMSGAHPAEPQIAIDLLTTNETHFFREPKHFDYLGTHILPPYRVGRSIRVWSAAASSGEEPYTIAMVLAAGLGGGPWEVLASDLSSRVLERARTGHYAMARAQSIPREHLQAYCLKGVGPQEGTFVVDPKIRSRVQFLQINLIEAFPAIGEFEVIFLRNVMIYFDQETRRRVVARVLRHLRPGGYLFVGHSETLNGITDQLKTVVPSVYQKPPA